MSESLKKLRDAPTQSNVGREILDNMLHNQSEPVIPPWLDDAYDPFAPAISRAPFPQSEK
jgi:hypothetical protein